VVQDFIASIEKLHHHLTSRPVAPNLGGRYICESHIFQDIQGFEFLCSLTSPPPTDGPRNKYTASIKL
jgi:hypothetical protein